MNSLFCGPHSSFTYTYVADHSHWMHLLLGSYVIVKIVLVMNQEDQKQNYSRGRLMAGTPLCSEDC